MDISKLPIAVRVAVDSIALSTYEFKSNLLVLVKDEHGVASFLVLYEYLCKTITSANTWTCGILSREDTRAPALEPWREQCSVVLLSLMCRAKGLMTFGVW